MNHYVVHLKLYINNIISQLYLKRPLESPLVSKEIKPVNPKGNQPWLFTARTDSEAEAPILWSPDVKNWFTGKHPDPGKYWRQEEKGMTEDEIVGWHHWLDDMHLNKIRELLMDREAWHAAVHGDQSWICLKDWTTTTTYLKKRD